MSQMNVDFFPTNIRVKKKRKSGTIPVTKKAYYFMEYFKTNELSSQTSNEDGPYGDRIPGGSGAVLYLEATPCAVWDMLSSWASEM